MTVDVLAIGAHPDDVEIGVGGLVRKLVQQGKTVGILDLTQGEMGSRGSMEERRSEAQQAARVLGVARRENVCLPDGGLCDCTEQQRAIIPFIRSFRPRVLLAPMRDDRHPDHEAAHFLVRDANYFAGLAKLSTDQEPWRAPRVYFYAVYRETEMPHLLVDVTDQFADKLEALRAYESQFHNPGYPGAKTYVASEEFWESIKTRAAYWGTRMGRQPREGQKTLYGEGLFKDGPIPIDTLPGL
ncbi:MAG: bacillithiol biosynthesis deacetylase BshB1 [bacterium]|nr:bacillithiol biosynthesis deacetylase BshB1 [bacterium]